MKMPCWKLIQQGSLPPFGRLHRFGDPEGSRLKSTLPNIRIELVLVPGCRVSRVTEIVWPSYLYDEQSVA